MAGSEERFRRSGSVATRSLETRSWVVHVEHPPSTQLGVDTATGLQLLLHGEVLGVGSDQATAVAGHLARLDPGAPAGLNGSFAALVVDPVADRVSVVTDRVNSRRVYGHRDPEGTWLATTLAGLTTARDLDPVGVGWYLANGDVHGSRTILDGVSVLGRASWNDITDGPLATRGYWRFAPGETVRDASEAALSHELGDLLVAAVRRHVADSPDLFVSLSGGYDATAIVGALRADLGARDARCLTYALGRAGRDSDEHRAAETARRAGFAFERVQSYDGDLVRAIERNASMSQGTKGFVHEADAWHRLGSTFASLRHPVVLAGDECFGGALDHTIRTRDDALRSVGIRGFGVLERLAGHVPGDTLDGMAAGMAADTEAILARCPSSGDPRDAKDFLYLDQRLANVISPWREGFASRFATLRNPLLDNDLLDFVAALPAPLRRTKLLFRRTVARMYPDLFAVPRAKRSNYMVDLGQEIARHAPAIRRLATTGSSRLDDLVPPSAILALVDAAVSAAGRPPSLQARGRDLVRAALPPRASNVVRRYRPPAQFPPVDPATLVVRLLILRTALGQDEPPVLPG